MLGSTKKSGFQAAIAKGSKGAVSSRKLSPLERASAPVSQVNHKPVTPVTGPPISFFYFPARQFIGHAITLPVSRSLHHGRFWRSVLKGSGKIAVMAVCKDYFSSCSISPPTFSKMLASSCFPGCVPLPELLGVMTVCCCACVVG